MNSVPAGRPSKIPSYVAEIAPWLTVKDSEGFASTLSMIPRNKPTNDFPPVVPPRKICQLSREFHSSARTLTDPISVTLHQYQTGSYSLGISHQPNFLPSLNVAMQPVVLNGIANILGGKSSQLFSLLDYDVASDRRYRHAIFPSPILRDGYYSASIRRSHDSRFLLMSREIRPSRLAIEQVMTMIEQISFQDAAMIRKLRLEGSAGIDAMRQRLAMIRDYLTDAWAQSSRLSQMNSMLLSKIINVQFEMPIAFVEGHRVLRLMGEHCEYLWNRCRLLVAECRAVAGALEDSGLTVRRALVPDVTWVPFWGVCPRGHRVSLHWTSVLSLMATGRCGVCDVTLRISRHNVGHAVSSGSLIPKVMTDNLLDRMAWGHLAMCGYRGGLEHSIFSTMVADRLGLRSLPEFLSRRITHADLHDVVANPYYSLIDVLDRLSAPGSARAAEILSAGRGSVAHWILWHSTGQTHNLNDMVSTFIAS